MKVMDFWWFQTPLVFSFPKNKVWIRDSTASQWKSDCHRPRTQPVLQPPTRGCGHPLRQFTGNSTSVCRDNSSALSHSGDLLAHLDVSLSLGILRHTVHWKQTFKTKIFSAALPGLWSPFQYSKNLLRLLPFLLTYYGYIDESPKLGRQLTMHLILKYSSPKLSKIQSYTYTTHNGHLCSQGMLNPFSR